MIANKNPRQPFKFDGDYTLCLCNFLPLASFYTIPFADK